MTVQQPSGSREERFAPFWQAAAEGRLVVQRCTACDNLQYYPRRRCISCGGEGLDYQEVSGRATLYSFATVLRYPPSAFTDDLPYTLAIVKLAEGPQMLTRMVDCDPDSLRCEMEVEVVFREGKNGRQLPCFKPAGAEG